MGARFRLVSAGVFSIAVAAGGCSSDSAPPAQKVDPAASAQASARYTGDIVRQLGRALAFEGGEDSLFGKLLGSLGGSSSVPLKSVRTAMPAPLPRPMTGPLLRTPAAKGMLRPSFLNLQTQEENFDDTAADLEALVEKRLLAEANVEAKTDTEVTYLLRGDPTCRPLPSRILEGAADVVDAGCAADLMKLQVRVVVRGDGDGWRFQVLLGPDRLELSAFVIHSDMLAWEADLDQARRATDFANQALGESAAAFPFAVLKGRIKVAVTKLGEKKASISFGVLDAIDIQGKADEPFSFALGKGDPAWAVTGDGASKQVTVKWAVPRADVKAPWDPRDTGARNTDLHVSIGGVTGETTLEEAAQQVTLKGYGYGPSFVAVRGTHIVDWSWNPGNGNKADVTIKVLSQAGKDDQARFEISPRLEATLGFKLAAIASDFDEPPPAFMANETYTLLLDGATPVVVETVAGNATGFAGGFKVVAGALKLSTTSSPAATVMVPAGQCLTSNDMPADGAHELLGSLRAAACP
jgi:hypothetical protein